MPWAALGLHVLKPEEAKHRASAFGRKVRRVQRHGQLLASDTFVFLSFGANQTHASLIAAMVSFWPFKVRFVSCTHSLDAL